ncbi:MULTISPECIES: alcohol dehydrogenase [Mesonia]|uniref:Alcohol dehydrogenase n=1 Tax=Mesonia oceanica TaxID=2687242 RepID=A0AC61YCT6_9FLAO|nr:MULTISPECIES: alcohol dehydrogenase [Mesonia]MAN26457.1 alcohol dehydrogenase [Mesonia sp.]MAQ41559.1 alcohol dehydrogenase [Mesonia sp.]MBJ96355.1 alcohol dehydrogenase [Flavobacteriaceae bacterium]VVV02256.1 Alcohol dehydrogenase [Mesonia oceanica]|tara:strand:- start:7126 stop:8130 length:1005 start_codon:yes stop_codon:yes gene_type:complete
MKAAQIKAKNGDFELVEIDKPSPLPNEILIKVEACGICHSDNFVKTGAFPGLEYPRTPGHEVVGTIEELGSEVKQWNKNQRVGIGWHGGHCFECEPCRRGDFVSCDHAKISGISYNGGYAEYMTAPQEAVVSIPEKLKSAEAAPLLCAGITVFNAMRNAGLRAGDLVAVQGIGGLGHLAIQYANKMGMRTIAISTSDDKKDLAHKLGAHDFINAKKDNAAEKLQELGGAKLILATAPSGKAISSVVDGLGIDGKLLTVAATGEAMEVSTMQLIMGRKTIAGWPSGTPIDSEDTLNFSAMTNTKPMIEEYPLDQVNEAFEKMMNNEARFRIVLKP